jgi:hypothetical protein
MNNIYGMSEPEIEAKLEGLRRDGGYRNSRAVNHKKLMEQIEELEKRLYKLKTMNKKIVHKLV